MKEIVQEGAEVLREVAQPVPEELFGTSELAKMIKDMTKALDPELEGVALAAPQIDIPYRIFIVRMDRVEPPVPPSQLSGLTAKSDLAVRPLSTPRVDVYINPEIVKTSRKKALMDEGCLSVRGIYGTTKRHERVTIRAQREDGSRFERGAGGLLAQIFEHETDHLNGILFIDHAEHLIDTTHEPTA